LPFGIEATGYTLEAIFQIDPEWISKLRQLVIDGPCEFVGSGYAQIIGPLVPAEVNAANLRIGNAVYERLLGFRPQGLNNTVSAMLTSALSYWVDVPKTVSMSQISYPTRPSLI
jgi:predicted glycosyl hydrolase (DUF1957 family)